MTMAPRILAGEKGKTCTVVAAGGLLYVADAAFEQRGIEIAWGVGIFFIVHAIVLFAKLMLTLRKAIRGEDVARLVKFVVGATLASGFLAVCCIYLSGRGFSGDWPAYINALVIGGLSSAFHLIPLERFRRKPHLSSLPPKDR